MGFKKYPTPDKVLELIQAAIEAALNELGAKPLNGGRVIRDVALTTGQDNLVAHKLGVVPQAWVVVDQDTDATVWSPAAAALGDERSTSLYLNLRCSSSCTIALWVS